MTNTGQDPAEYAKLLSENHGHLSDYKMKLIRNCIKGTSCHYDGGMPCIIQTPKLMKVLARMRLDYFDDYNKFIAKISDFQNRTSSDNIVLTNDNINAANIVLSCAADLDH